MDKVPVLVERAPLKIFKEIKTIIGAFNFIKQEISNVAFIRQGLYLNVKKDSSLGIGTKEGKNSTTSKIVGIQKYSLTASRL